MSTATPMPADGPEWTAIIDAARALVAKHPDAAPVLRQQMTFMTETAEYPRLVAEAVTDDGETFEAVRCPWCDAIVSEDEDEGLVIIDQDDRWTPVTPDEYDHERQAISPDYSSDSDYEGLHYMHGACGQPVKLPEGWVER